MPRSRSISILSSTCSRISRAASPPQTSINRSARVDLPWSICAMIAKLRMSRSGVMESCKIRSTARRINATANCLCTRPMTKPISEPRLFEAGLLGRYNHGHLPAFHPRHLLDLGDLVEIVSDAHQHVHPELLMRQLTPAEPHCHLHLIALLDEFDHAAHFNVVVVVVDAVAQFNLFNFDDFLFFARFVLFLLFFVFVLAEVEDFADRRVGVRRYLDKIEAGIGGHRKRFVTPDDSDHVAALVDEANAQDGDVFVDPGPFPGGGKVQRWSSYVQSPLLG